VDNPIYVRIRSTGAPIIDVVDAVANLPVYVIDAVHAGKTAVFGDALYGSTREQLASASDWDD
jgi:hypothetical protein